MASTYRNASHAISTNGGAVSAPLQRTPRGSQFQPTGVVRPLKEEVLEAIAPWRDSINKPPFSTGELIVITLVVGDLKPQSMHDIHVEILSAFKYYSRAVVASYVSHLEEQAKDTYDPDDRLEPILGDLNAAIRDFDTPLSCVHDTTKNLDRYTISAGAARVFLRKHLEPPREGVFDFLGLPAELREKIYKMVLVFPKPGLRYWEGPDLQYDDEDARVTELGLLSRDDVEPPTYDGSSKLPENNIRVKGLASDLALLGTSREIRQEALHIFYGRNSFHFESPWDLPWVLGKLTQDTLQHFGEIRIAMDSCDPHESRAFRRFYHMSLKKLVVIAPNNDRFWNFLSLHGSVRGPPPPIDSSMLEEHYCLGPLLSLAKRAKNFEIQGDGKVGKWLRNKVEESRRTKK